MAHVIATCSADASIWAIVLDDTGKSLEGVEISLGGSPGTKSDVNGLVKFDGLVDGAIHPVTLARLERPHDGLYELPAPLIKSATAKAGTVTQVLFILPHRPKLRVVLRPIGFVDLPAAQVVLSRIMGKDHRNGRTTVRLEEVEAKDHVDGKVDFAHQAVHAYRVSVKI
ncbi:MAG: hypothetical protein IAG13_29200, partial [Deltaproteobacteria bacterium]|nr:hypothetical protein [Nannocystaceae bacterium]